MTAVRRTGHDRVMGVKVDSMKLSEICKLVNAEFVYAVEERDPDVCCCMASDMMSDVLAYATPTAMLITGLINSKSVRTADIADASAVLYIRGKKPDEQTVELAQDLGIPLLSTKCGMFETCGILHEAGLNGIC